MVEILLIIFPLPIAKPVFPHSKLKFPLPLFHSSNAVPALEVFAERLIGWGHEVHAIIPKVLTGFILGINPNRP